MTALFNIDREPTKGPRDAFEHFRRIFEESDRRSYPRDPPLIVSRAEGERLVRSGFCAWVPGGEPVREHVLMRERVQVPEGIIESLMNSLGCSRARAEQLIADVLAVERADVPREDIGNKLAGVLAAGARALCAGSREGQPTPTSRRARAAETSSTPCASMTTTPRPDRARSRSANARA